MDDGCIIQRALSHKEIMRSARIIETTPEYKLTAQLQDRRLTLTLDVYQADHTLQHVRVLANGLIPRIGTIDKLYSILMRNDAIGYQVLPGQARIIFQLEDGGYDLWLGNGKLVATTLVEPAIKRKKKGQISAYELGKIVQRKLETERQQKTVKKVIVHYEKQQSEMIADNQSQSLVHGQSKRMEEERQPQPNAENIQNGIQQDKKQAKQIQHGVPIAVDMEDEVKSEDKAQNGLVLCVDTHKDTDQPCHSYDKERERKPAIGATNTRVLRPRHKKQYREDSQRKEEKPWNYNGNRPKKVARNTPQTAIQLSEQPEPMINLPIKLQFQPVSQPQPSLYYQLEMAREQVAVLSKTIEQLRFIVVEQGYEIQRMADLNRHYSMLLAHQKQEQGQEEELEQGRNQPHIRQVNGRFKSKSVRKRQEITMREWQISTHCADYDNFTIEGLRVTLHSKDDEDGSQWSILYLTNPITKDKPFTLRVRIHRSKHKNIAIGIGALKNQQKKSSWNQKQCIEYIGSTRAVVQNNKTFFESGYGIGEGDEIAMRVDCGRISWTSERGLEAELQYGRFLDTRDKLVPFVRMKDCGDCVQFVGRPL